MKRRTNGAMKTIYWCIVSFKSHQRTTVKNKVPKSSIAPLLLDCIKRMPASLIGFGARSPDKVSYFLDKSTMKISSVSLIVILFLKGPFNLS